MSFIVFFCSSDLFFGSPSFMRPNSALSFFLSFATSSKVILPICIFLKIVFGPLNSIKLTEWIFESLK